jgi:transposase
MERQVLMSRKEARRKVEFEGVKARRMSIREASGRLGLSYRQCRRSYKRYREQGDKGLVHRSRGRPSNRGKGAKFKDNVLARYGEEYKDYGPTLAAEELAKEGYVLDHETLRRWLMADGQWQRQRQGRKHRTRREPRAHFGELVQIDGSHHRWFGDDHDQCCLMDMVDDATGTTVARMACQETTEACMRVLWQWIETYGIPHALYTDKKTVFVTDRTPTLEEQLAGQEPMTAFGKACAKLGIEMITAHSPQAKGRVERKHRVYQDRFVKLLKRKGITTIDEANELLNNGFVDGLNDNFATPPASEQNFHRPVPKKLLLSEVFCYEETRTVCNDWTIRYDNRFFQLLKAKTRLPRPGAKVIVRRLLDGSLQIVYRKRKLRFKAISQPETRPKNKPPERAVPTKTRTRYIPPPDHPWRQGIRAAAPRTRR